MPFKFTIYCVYINGFIHKYANGVFCVSIKNFSRKRIREFIVEKKFYLGSAFVLLAVILGIIIIESNRSDNLAPQNVEIKKEKSLPKEHSKYKPEIIGQVKNPSDIDTSGIRVKTNFKPDPKRIKEQTKIYEEGYGKFPSVKTDEKNMNAHKKNLINALKDPVNNSGTISIVGQRQAFDPERFKNDPSYYLDTTEPGRAFDSAQAGEDVPQLQRIGNSTQRIKQGESCTLTVKGAKNGPISFTAFDGGHFQNGLNAITLQANSAGFASAQFHATAGVINQARVRAASPVCSQSVSWTAYIHLQDQNN